MIWSGLDRSVALGLDWTDQSSPVHEIFGPASPVHTLGLDWTGLLQTLLESDAQAFEIEDEQFERLDLEESRFKEWRKKGPLDKLP